MGQNITLVLTAGLFTIVGAFIGGADFWYNFFGPALDTVNYDVTVKTRKNDRSGRAGTDGDVTFTAFSGQSSSSFTVMGAGQALNQGAVDRDVAPLALFGSIDRLQMSIVEKGERPGWLPQYVLFENTVTNEKICFYWEDLSENFVGSSGKARIKTIPVKPNSDITKCTG